MKQRLFVLCGLVTLSACGAQTTPPASSTVPAPPKVEPAAAPETPAPSSPVLPPPKPAAASFGFDQVAEACGSFSAHVTNADRTAWLDIAVGVKSLGLGPGEHQLEVTQQHVTLTVTELPTSYQGEWSCTDILSGSPPEVSGRWKAISGKLRIKLYAPAKPPAPYEGPYDRVDVELVGVRFVDEGGQAREVSVRFEGLGIGWLPG